MMQQAAFLGVLTNFNVQEQRQFQLEFILERFLNRSSQMGLCKEYVIEWRGMFCWVFFSLFNFFRGFLLNHRIIWVGRDHNLVTAPPYSSFL